ncbi:putative ammonium transporter 2 [Cloeon dipterum]|uniref:putative ammonium transporter 2 n=1 Tax=Cloeon dipterum TaxID=197152 RepID=UPI00321FCA29
MGDNATRPHVPWLFDLGQEDSNWVMTSSFIILTMQTGFGLLESGCVSLKNGVNIMMKNVVDVVFGGLTYWAFGFGLSFGRSPLNTPFYALGDFMLDPDFEDELMGPMFAAFLFQLSFATTATTIVSGAMAERCNFKAYCLFSLINTIVYCIPAGWVWGEHGFLFNLGVVDIAGSGPVHLVGGTSAFTAALMLGPRLGRYLNGNDPLPLGSPVNAIMGLFVLWWGWLAFNSGSTYGVTGAKWQYAATAAVLTLLASFGGGSVGLLYSGLTRAGYFDIMDLINGVLGALVSITAGCFLYRTYEAVLVGAIGATIACTTMPYFDKMGVDDPVGASSVHGLASMWGVLAVGLFAEDPKPLTTTGGRKGLFKGGGWELLGVQALSVLCLTVWAMVSTAIILMVVNWIIPIRMTEIEELLGADYSEHRIMQGGHIGVSRAVSALRPYHEMDPIGRTGTNPGHNAYLELYVKEKQKEIETTRDEVKINLSQPFKKSFSGKMRNPLNLRRPESALSTMRNNNNNRNERPNDQNEAENATSGAFSSIPTISINTDYYPRYAWLD